MSIFEDYDSATAYLDPDSLYYAGPVGPPRPWTPERIAAAARREFDAARGYRATWGWAYLVDDVPSAYPWDSPTPEEWLETVRQLADLLREAGDPRAPEPGRELDGCRRGVCAGRRDGPLYADWLAGRRASHRPAEAE